VKKTSKALAVGAASPLTVEVRVGPRAGRQALWREPGGLLRAAVQAAPERGKANEELVRLVAERLGIARSQVELWKGHRSRKKVLRIWGVKAEALQSAFEALG